MERDERNEPVRPSVRKTHPALDPITNSPGGLFDVPPCELDLDVGKWCVPKEPDYPADWQPARIVAVQKVYTGDLAYRVVQENDTAGFGRPARPADVDVFDTREAAWERLRGLMAGRVGREATWLRIGDTPPHRVRLRAVELIDVVRLPGGGCGYRVRVVATGRTRAVPATAVQFPRGK